MDHIARLEVENQSICLHHHMRERKEKKLVAENETMASKLANLRQFIRDSEVSKLQFTESVCASQEVNHEL